MHERNSVMLKARPYIMLSRSLWSGNVSETGSESRCFVQTLYPMGWCAFFSVRGTFEVQFLEQIFGALSMNPRDPCRGANVAVGLFQKGLPVGALKEFYQSRLGIFEREAFVEGGQGELLGFAGEGVVGSASVAYAGWCQVVTLQTVVAGEQCRALNEITQFADIARPTVILEFYDCVVPHLNAF